MIITILLAGLLLIFAAGIRCGFALDDLIRMAVNGIKKAVNVLSVLAIVGILTAMWRADGTIAYIVSSAAGLFKPSILIVTIFLMNCFFYDRDFIWNSCNDGRDQYDDCRYSRC